MKTNNFFNLLLITFGIVLLTSCESDDSETERINEVTVNSNSFVISNAVITDEDTFNGITEFDIYFTSEGVTIDEGTNINGSGDFLYLRLFSSIQTELEAGTYVYNDQDDDSLLINRGSHFFGFDASQGDGQLGHLDIESGSITVVVDNNQYTITFNLIDEAGDNLTGYYNGAITLLD